MIKNFLKDENGQGMVEYALLVGLISVAAIVVLLVLGPKIRDMFNEVNSALDNAKTN